MAKFCAIISIVCSSMLLPADTLLSDFLLDNSVILQWDSYLQTGVLWKDNKSMSFVANSPYILLNFDTVKKIEAIAYHGESLLLAESTLAFLQELFPPDKDLLPRAYSGYTTVSAIVIDPGHGGRDPGASNQIYHNGAVVDVLEKDIVLNVALFLQRLLIQHYPDKKIIISRNSDNYISLDQRTAQANAVQIGEQESILFVSLHANASLNKDARGFEVWYLPPEVQRKNVVSQTLSKDPDVLSILNTLRDEELTIESAMLAQSILRSLEKQIGSSTNNRGIRQESWYVVRNARMPSVLVEIGFITNDEEARLLIDTAYLQQIAVGLMNGIRNFISTIERQT